jgi:hypothetical protein
MDRWPKSTGSHFDRLPHGVNLNNRPGDGGRTGLVYAVSDKTSVRK